MNDKNKEVLFDDEKITVIENNNVKEIYRYNDNDFIVTL